MLKIVNRNCAGIDVHKKIIVVTIAKTNEHDITDYQTKSFNTFTEDLIKRSDVILNYNHNDEQIIARSVNGEGTLHLEADEKGLYFECKVPNTTLGNDIYENIKLGNLFECSFCFILTKESSQNIYKTEDGVLVREILSIDGLYDCAICPHGAYSSTSVEARSQVETAYRNKLLLEKLDAINDEIAEQCSRISNYKII